MTNTSINEFKNFLDNYALGPKNEDIDVADYGGNEELGSTSIKQILSLYGINKYTILDFSTGFDLRNPIPGKKFDFGICMDLLEHVSNPFIVSKNIKDNLNKGALLYVTVPWVWPVHGDPEKYFDYWRFAPDGLKELFNDMEEVVMYGSRDSYVPDEEVPKEAFAPDPPYMRLIGVFRKI